MSKVCCGNLVMNTACCGKMIEENTVSTKPTAQELGKSLAEFRELAVRDGYILRGETLLRDCAAELASQRQGPEADRIEALSRRVYHGMDDADLPAIQAALRAYAASLRSTK